MKSPESLKQIAALIQDTLDLFASAKPTPQRLSDEELGTAAYASCKKVYQTDILTGDYTGGFRDGYRACEEHLLGEKK